MLELRPKCLVLSLLCAGIAAGQSEQPPSKAALRFEVADVQECQVKEEIHAGFLPGGRVDLRNLSLNWILAAVYKTSTSLISGPSWLGSANFDIVAKAAPAATREELYEMTRNLLAERFHLVVHREPKTVAVYALVAARSGPRLTPSEPSTPFGCPPAPAAPGVKEPPGMIHRVCRGASMADLAQVLPLLASSYLDGLPVVDLTGIEGRFDLPLDWTSRGAYNQALTANQGLAPPDGATQTIFDALERLGLRLELRKHALDGLVIDRIDRHPTPN